MLEMTNHYYHSSEVVVAFSKVSWLWQPSGIKLNSEFIHVLYVPPLFTQDFIF